MAEMRKWFRVYVDAFRTVGFKGSLSAMVESRKYPRDRRIILYSIGSVLCLAIMILLGPNCLDAHAAWGFPVVFIGGVLMGEAMREWFRSVVYLGEAIESLDEANKLDGRIDRANEKRDGWLLDIFLKRKSELLRRTRRWLDLSGDVDDDDRV